MAATKTNSKKVFSRKRSNFRIRISYPKICTVPVTYDSRSNPVQTRELANLKRVSTREKPILCQIGLLSKSRC